MANDLTRLSVNLTARSDRALQLAVDLGGDSKTDTVNRALQFYAYFLSIKDKGGTVYTREGPEAELYAIELL
jgi:hypothetical protein